MKKIWRMAAAGMLAMAAGAQGSELLGRVELRGAETWLAEIESAAKGTPLAGSVPMWPMLLDEALGLDAFELLDGEGLVAAEAWGTVTEEGIDGIGVALELPAKDPGALLAALDKAYGPMEDGRCVVGEGMVILAEAGEDGRAWLGISDEDEAARAALDGSRAGGGGRKLSAEGTLAAGAPDAAALRRAYGAFAAASGEPVGEEWEEFMSGLEELSWGVGLADGVARFEESFLLAEGAVERWGMGLDGSALLGAAETVYAVNLEGALAVVAAKGSRAGEAWLALQKEQFGSIAEKWNEAGLEGAAEKFREAMERVALPLAERAAGADFGAAWLPRGTGESLAPRAVAMAEGVRGVGELREWLRAHAETMVRDVVRWAGAGDADDAPVAIEWRGEREGPGGEAVDEYAVVLKSHEAWNEALSARGVELPMDAAVFELAWDETAGRIVASTAGREATDEVLRRAADGTGRDPRGEAGYARLFGETGGEQSVAWFKAFEGWREGCAWVSSLAGRYGDEEERGQVSAGVRMAANILPESEGVWAGRARYAGERNWRAEFAFGIAEWRRFGMNAYNQGARMAMEAFAEAMAENEGAGTAEEGEGAESGDAAGECE